MVDDPVQRTIAQLPIGFEHGGEDAKCCICCGGCYSGCCACKPEGDLKLTVIQWYAKYETGGAEGEYSWKKIATPCDVEVTLTKRTYECMGSGAQEDNRYVDDGAGGYTDMTAVDFYLKYGRYAQNYDGDSPSVPLPGGPPPSTPPPMSLSEAQHLAYNDWWRTTQKRVRGTACAVFPPIIAGKGIEINARIEPDLEPLEEPHKPGITDPNPDDYENRESWSRETWGFTGKICKYEAGCVSKDYEPPSKAAGIDGAHTDGFPDWKFRTNDCDGMCISINLCCCKMDGFEGQVYQCASDTNGTFAVHPDVDADADTFGADGKLEGVSTPYNLYWENEDGIDFGLSAWPNPPEFYGEGYTFDEKTDEYPCKSECFKLSLNPYNCYSYSGAAVSYGPSVDGSIIYNLDTDIEGVGPFPMTQVLHNAVVPGPEVGPGALYPYYEEKHKFNTPCSPCTYLERGFYYPNVASATFYAPQPYGADAIDTNVAWNYADDGDTSLHQTEKGMRFLQHVLQPPIVERKTDEWDVEYVGLDKGNLYYLPNRPTQCKCPRDEEAAEGEKGCTVDRKFMLKYAVVFESNCDCTIGIDADAVFPGGETNAPIERLGPVDDPDANLVPRYAIERVWLGNDPAGGVPDPQVIIANPTASTKLATAPGGSRDMRTRQPIKGVFRWDILITEAD